MKKLLIILTILLINQFGTFAQCENCNKFNHKPTAQEIKAFDNALAQRLNLTEEQKKLLKENRIKYKKKMEPIVKEMQSLHDEIKSIYNCSYHKFQADIDTAMLKAKLVLAKQKADKLREENRKNFKNILTEEQKIEFEKFKKDLAQKKQPKK